MDLEKLIELAFGGRPDFDKNEAYYEKSKRLEALGVTLPEDVRILELVSSYPKLAVDVLVEVLNLEGFTLKNDNDKTPELLRKWFQANNMDTILHLAITEALVQGQSFLIAGKSRTEGIPRVTMHSAKNIRFVRDDFGDISEAVVLHGINEDDVKAECYFPFYRQTHAKVDGKWQPIADPVPTGTKYVPVVPFTNMSRIKDRQMGRSEMAEVMDLADGESRSMTGLQTAQELVALPQRYLFANGLTEFKDQNGNAISKFKAYISSIWTGPADAKAGTLQGADLTQIINVVKLYAQKVSSLTGIPPSMLGISTDNPASAEAMRVAKDRLITKGEFKQHLFGDSIEDLAKIMLDMYDETPEGIETLEAKWRDVATPSKSAEGANILQAHAQGAVSARTAREYLPLTPEQRAWEDQHEEEFQALASSIGLTGRQARPTRPATPTEERQQ